jgi:hypothetical protein
LILRLWSAPGYLLFCYGLLIKIKIIENEGLLVSSGNVKKGWGFFSLLLAASLVFTPVSVADAAIDVAWTQTSRADFESAILQNLDASGSPGSIKLSIAGVDYLYAFRGNNQRTFWRYSISSNTWVPLADAPDYVRWGGSLAYDGGNNIYAFHGNNSNDFWRYNISSDNWTVLPGAPGTVKEGGALTFNNGYVYALRGNNTKDFWRYHSATNSWTVRAGTHDNVLMGGALIGDGGNYIYAFQHENTQAFWRYDISANTWILLADTPAAVGAGAALTYDGRRYIYAFCGGMTPSFWQYDITANTWAVLSFTPSYIDWGGSLSYTFGNNIYAVRGASAQHFWRYNISTDAWEGLAGTPAVVNDGGALVRGGIRYYNSGALESSTMDAGYNAVFGNISWTAVISLGTAIKFQVAANSDNLTWIFKGPDGTSSTYYTSSGASIWPGHEGSRFMRYKAFFTTANTSITPVLDDVTLTYRKQILLPAAAAGEASPVEETTAVLHGMVSNDGGEPCQYRFRYGKSTGNYTQESDWIGSVISGESFGVNITGLAKGVRYYFRAQVKNSAGTANSTEFSLLTRPAPPVAGSFTAKTISATQIDLSWVKGEGAQRTMVRRKTEDYPADRNDGVQVYFDTGSKISDTLLKPNTTYYYSAWSEVTGSQQWSNSSQKVSAATLDGAPIVVGGTVHQVNKVTVLAPWLGAFILFLAGGGVTARRLKRKKA